MDPFNRQKLTKFEFQYISENAERVMLARTNDAAKSLSKEIRTLRESIDGAARNILSELASALMRRNVGIVNMKLSELKGFVDKEHDA